MAEHIRTEDRNAVIIFMTNHSEMMQKAFDVQAFQYLVKPIDSDTTNTMTIFTKINTFLNVLIPDDSAATSSELATRLNASIKEKESVIVIR